MIVFLGGSVGEYIPEKYIQEAKNVAEYIIKQKYDIACCPDERGIIGEIYKRVKQAGTVKVFFVVPKIYEKYATNLKEEIDIITNTINERTDTLIKKSEICLFLPGGIGTIYEILSCIETKRAGEHSNEIIILNLFGFFNNLIEMLDKIYEEKFADIKHKKNYRIINKIEEI